jgi:hypothetical protein
MALSNLDDILTLNEKVIWHSKPQKTVYVLPALGFILFALIFASFFSFLLYSANPSEILWIIPIGIGSVIGLIPTVWQLRKSPKVEYMITNQRLLIKSGAKKDDVWFTDLSRLKESLVKKGLVDRLFGTGKIYPITPEYPYAPKLRTYSIAGMNRQKKVYNIVEGKDDMVSEIELYRKSLSHPHLEGLKEQYGVQKLLNQASSTRIQL